MFSTILQQGLVTLDKFFFTRMFLSQSSAMLA